MKISLVLSTHAASFEPLVYQGDLEQNVAQIASLGYDGVELAVRDPNLLDAEHIRRLMADHGLEVPAIGTGQAYNEEGLSFTDPDQSVRARAVERIIDQIDLASTLGAMVIVGLIRGRVVEGAGRERAMDWLVAALQECLEEAARRDVKLALEPLNRYETELINTVAEGLSLVARMKTDNFGLLLDTFHMNIEEPSIEESILQAGPHIFHFHVADSNRLYPGGGHLGFATIVTALREVGYRGYLSVEALPLPDAQRCAQRAIEHLRQMVQ
jgi:sugar phosphate isomerase/epimerase